MPLTITTIDTIDDVKTFVTERTAAAVAELEAGEGDDLTEEQLGVIDSVRTKIASGAFGCNTQAVKDLATDLVQLAVGRSVDLDTIGSKGPKTYTIIVPESAVKQHGHGYKVGKPCLAFPGKVAFRAATASLGETIKNDWRYATPEEIAAFFTDLRKPHTLLALIEARVNCLQE